MFSIDGLEWPVKCKIERKADLKASEVSGLMLDKTYRNDCIGTYLSYDVSIAVPFGMEDDYTAIYEALTDPVDGHAFVLPYNQGEISLTARVVSVKDTNYDMPSGHYWAGTQFSIIANHPTKTQTLEEAITRGLAPLPEIGGVQIGDIYQYTADGWVPYTPPSYINADEVSY